MSERVTLDNIDMRARLRSPRPATATFSYRPRPVARPSRQLFQETGAAFHEAIPTANQPVQPMAEEAPLTVPVPWATPEPAPRPFASPESAVTHHLLKPNSRHLRQPKVFAEKPQGVPLKARLQARFAFVTVSRSSVLTAMAVTVFVVGISASFIGFRTNNLARAQLDKINKTTNVPTTTSSDDSTPPTTTPVTVNTIEAYKVAADLPRTITIPKINVYARVLQVGTTSSGALATPTNVFDTAWYKGSAKPGQPGTTLIDGHVSSWTTNGVFYNIKNLVAGDVIKVEKGDGTSLSYTVVRTTAYPASNVDMHALLSPITTGKSGLNLITCGGKYDSKAGEFTERIAVFATLD